MRGEKCILNNGGSGRTRQCIAHNCKGKGGGGSRQCIPMTVGREGRAYTR